MTETTERSQVHAAFDDDFRVGGSGVNEGRFGDGPMYKFLSTYTDIVEQQRIVYVYDMWLRRRAHLHLAHDRAEGREEGTGDLLDALGRSLVT